MTEVTFIYYAVAEQKHFKGYMANLQALSVVYKSNNSKNDSGPQYGHHYVITQIFLEVVGRGKGFEVTTKKPSGTESSQYIPREGSLYKI